MSNNQVEKIRYEYNKKVEESRLKAAAANVMNNLHQLSKAQQESIKALAQIDDLSSGKLEDLVGIYKTIKSNNSKTK